MDHPRLLDKVIDEQPYPFVFVTLSGAHLYGFESADSDFDIRGCHVLPARDVVGLMKGPDTIEASSVREGVELDLVSHDAEKFFGMMLKKNGYVLEQLFSPLVLRTGEDHERLKKLGHGCITRHHGHHYVGFAQNQWKLFLKETPPRVKPLLYTYRVVLTGIHLLRTGQVEANLLTLNEDFGLPYIDELVARKQDGAEKERLEDADLAFHTSEYQRLMGVLEQARSQSTLPESPSSRDDLHELLVDLRLRHRVP